MAVQSEYVEEQDHKKPPSAAAAAKPFSAALNPSEPLGFLAKVFEFVARESDLFKSDSLVRDVNAVVKKIKAKLEAEERKMEESEKNAAERKAAEAVKVKETKPEEEAKGPRDPNNLNGLDMEAEERKKKESEKKAVLRKREEALKVKEKVMVDNKEAETKPEEEANGPRAPNKSNGLDMDTYSWGQSLQEVNVYVHVPSGTKPRLIVCEIKKNHLKVGVKGQPPVIDGELFGSVKVDDCFWSLEDRKTLSILLTKQDGMEWWKYVVKGEPEIDIRKAEPENSRVADLNPETRSMVQKLMFDQRQKKMGLPTSDEMQKQESVKEFMAQHPEMKFSMAKTN